MAIELCDVEQCVRGVGTNLCLTLAANCEGALCGPRCFGRSSIVNVGHRQRQLLKLGLYVGHYLVSSTGDAG